MNQRALLAALLFAGGTVWAPTPTLGQVTTAPAPAKPTEHIVGTLIAVDAGAQTVTVREDGTEALRKVQVGSARTLLKVPPHAKDLKTATRITASELGVGDRLDVRGFKVDSDPTATAARSIIVMSGAEVQQVRQQEAAAWQHASTGTVTSVDTAGQKLNVTLRTAQGPKAVIVDAAGAEFTRYSPEKPQTPASSQISEIRPGDQVRVISREASGVDTGSVVHAQKIYSGTFRSALGTVVSIAPDGMSLIVKDLQTKQPVTVALSDESAVRKLPPMMAYMLARRFNPDFKGAPEGATASGGSAPARNPDPPPAAPPGRPAGEDSGQFGMRAGERLTGGTGPTAGMMRGANGDLSHMLERVPKIPVTDLKTGDAVVIAGSPASGDKGTLLAHTVIAGVEPIFQSASPRQAQSLSDWSNNIGGGMPSEPGGGTAGGGPPQ